jgi:3',5'-cyclic AMP phosphodiesterase CpdA
MKIVALSDTHGRHSNVVVPDGDVLVVAGDILRCGSRKEIPAYREWLASLPHEWKLIIAGNHDWAFQNTPSEAWRLLRGGLRNIIYLRDAYITLDGVKFWGAPWQPEFFDWAFNLPRGAPLDAVWSKIPDDTDVLITHGPPLDIMDYNMRDQRFGDADLLRHIQRVKPKVHIFGHAHAARGEMRRYNVRFYNVAICNESYEPVNLPMVIEV